MATRAELGGGRLVAPWRRLFERPEQVLLPYRQEKITLRQRLGKFAIITLIALTGLIYGFFVAVFPYWLYLFLAGPITIVALLVIWALPKREWVPTRQIEWLFWAFLISLLAWPNYLAIAIPGLPWITIQRLFLGPLTLLLLVALSTNAEFRADIKRALADSPVISTLMIAFTFIQVVTFLFTEHFGMSMNRFVSNQLAWTTVFFVSVWLFQLPGRVDKWFNLVIALTLFACGVALIELSMEKVPWADHIPSFLAVNDLNVQNILSGERARTFTNKYRVAGTFVHPLNLAEFIGLATPLFIHRVMYSERFIHRALHAAAFPLMIFVIVSTDSRLGSVAFFASFLLYAFLWGCRRWLTNRADLIAPTLILGYPVGIAGFLTLSIVWNRLNYMMWGGDSGAAVSSTLARTEQLALFWPKFFAWPFGYGVGQSGEALLYFSPGGMLTVDSYFITIALEYGALGFLAFFGMFAVAGLVAARWSVFDRADKGRDFMPIAVMMPIFILIKTVLSQDNEHALIFMALGLLIAMNHARKQRFRQQPHHETAPAARLSLLSQ